MLLALGAALAMAFAASARWWVGYLSEYGGVEVSDGTVYFSDMDGLSAPFSDWGAGRNVTHGWGGKQWIWTWWIWGAQKDLPFNTHAYSIWPLAPLALLTGGALYWSGRRAWRRARSGRCTRCGYTLAGLPPSTLCPECGEPSIDLAPLA